MFTASLSTRVTQFLPQDTNGITDVAQVFRRHEEYAMACEERFWLIEPFRDRSWSLNDRRFRLCFCSWNRRRLNWSMGPLIWRRFLVSSGYH